MNLFLIFTICICSSYAFEANQYVVGGKAVTLGKWPWMSLITRSTPEATNGYYAPICGASLIQPNYVITAAKCVTGAPSNYLVHVGIISLPNIYRPTGIQVQSVKRYPGSRGTINDIALVQLAYSAANAQPIKIAEYEGSPTECTIAGFGAVTGDPRQAYISRLLDGAVGLQPHAQCVRSYRFVRENMHICTGGASLCNGGNLIRMGFLGDIGGPLMCKKAEDDWRLYGVASYHHQQCDQNFPSVFTRVSSFSSWINRESGAQCSSVESRYTFGGRQAVSKDEVWCNMGRNGQIMLTRGGTTASVACTYAWQVDDGEFGVELNCEGYTITKVSLNLSSAKAQALCSAKHQLMQQGPNKPVGDTVAVADGQPHSRTAPIVTIRCNA